MDRWGFDCSLVPLLPLQRSTSSDLRITQKLVQPKYTPFQHHSPHHDQVGQHPYTSLAPMVQY